MSPLRRAHLTAAVAVTGYAAALEAATFVLPGTPIPTAALWVLFASAFLILTSALLPLGPSWPRTRPGSTGAERRDQQRQFWAGLRARIPPRAAAAIMAIVAFAWFAGLTAIISMQGQPGQQNGHYFANNHGTVIALTKAQYQRQLAQEHRILISGCLAIGAASAGLILARPATPHNPR